MEVQVLEKIVGLVDKYAFHEVGEMITEMWFQLLQPTMLEIERQDMVSGVYTCLVLQKPPSMLT